jgi:hypothetical protein
MEVADGAEQGLYYTVGDIPKLAREARRNENEKRKRQDYQK